MPPRSNRAPRISSFDQKPASGGMPAMAKVAMPMVVAVMGMRLARPPILYMSCSSDMAWITDPAPRNRSALKKAWVMRWNTPATYAVAPTPMNMYPGWERVEQARPFLMSRWPMAIEAAHRAVIAPMTATVPEAIGDST